MSDHSLKRIKPSPVLFLIFNRPDETERVFAEIRKARPTKLYIAGDGPRKHLGATEYDKVQKTRTLVLNNIDWVCDVKTLFREENLGCRESVSGAIDWFFENEEEGLVLEDDCLPAQSFFPFCAELLEYYRHDRRVSCITGGNFQDGRKRGDHSYYFSQVPHCWGWATWRDAWKAFHRAQTHFQKIINEPGYNNFTHNLKANSMWQDKFSKTLNGEIDSWAYIWTFANFVNNGVTALPNVNLVQNIGFGVDSTHTKRVSKYRSVKTSEISFPLSHPPYICIHRVADDFDYRHHFGISNLFIELFVKIASLISRLKK